MPLSQQRKEECNKGPRGMWEGLEDVGGARGMWEGLEGCG